MLQKIKSIPDKILSFPATLKRSFSRAKTSLNSKFKDIEEEEEEEEKPIIRPQNNYFTPSSKISSPLSTMNIGDKKILKGKLPKDFSTAPITSSSEDEYSMPLFTKCLEDFKDLEKEKSENIPTSTPIFIKHFEDFENFEKENEAASKNTEYDPSNISLESFINYAFKINEKELNPKEDLNNIENTESKKIPLKKNIDSDYINSKIVQNLKKLYLESQGNRIAEGYFHLKISEIKKNNPSLDLSRFPKIDSKNVELYLHIQKLNNLRKQLGNNEESRNCFEYLKNELKSLRNKSKKPRNEPREKDVVLDLTPFPKSNTPNLSAFAGIQKIIYSDEMRPVNPANVPLGCAIEYDKVHLPKASPSLRRAENVNGHQSVEAPYSPSIKSTVSGSLPAYSPPPPSFMSRSSQISRSSLPSGTPPPDFRRNAVAGSPAGKAPWHRDSEDERRIPMGE